MKKLNIILFLLPLIIFSCSENTKEEKTENTAKIYTCPMHPQIIRNQPGNCPICGMKLVEKKNDGDSAGNEIKVLLKPTNEYVISNVKTVHPDSMEFENTSEATGVISYDTREINVVAARVSGRITKMSVKYEYEEVKKGQKLMEIYSEELLISQQNLLFLLKNDPENKTLIQAAEKKLFLLGMTQQQIDRIKNDRTTVFSTSLFSPYNGHIHSFTSSNTSAGNSGKMENMNMNKAESKNTELSIREGSYVKKGENILTIYNTQKVWAIINISNENIYDIQKGDLVLLHIDGVKEKELPATIDFIEPTVNKGQKTTSARIFLNNQNQLLKIGMIVNAIVHSGNKRGIFIPLKAVVHLGKSDVVFVKEKDVFKSKIIISGNSQGDFIEVISGLNTNDLVAANGQMLIDSESFIKTSYDE